MAEQRTRVPHGRKREATGRGMATTRRERRRWPSLSSSWTGSAGTVSSAEEGIDRAVLSLGRDSERRTKMT
jgi:hypothetical protein